jgi:radical SAM superfamily enzyme YgiQ (UPF0313 family)
MQVLLLSMPDAFEHMPAVAVRMPNGALASLAANVDRHHRVAVADLILARTEVRSTVERLLRDIRPAVVGLSVMTFQRKTALQIAALVKQQSPDTTIVVGGYDPTLAPDAYAAATAIDFIVKGEGEHTFRDLLRAVEHGGPVETIAGLSYRRESSFVHNPPRPVLRLETEKLQLPNRRARVLNGYTLLGKQVDVVETSRGCTYDCSFCSIIEMRGRNFHPFPVDRVLADIADARANGARAIFLVDDNITLDVARFETLCRAIEQAGFNDVEYFVQAMTSSIANHGGTLAPLMRRAGFRYVFLGIENIVENDLVFLRARAKNARRDRGQVTGNASIAAIEHLHHNGMVVVGGLIVGNPDDTPESIKANLEFARRYVDWPYIQHPTPYPRTPMTKDFRDRNLIVDEDVAHYDGTTAVVRSETMSADDIEFMRWQAERWIKLRHFPSAALRNPGFVFRHGREMLGHTFAGCTWRSFVSKRSEREAFRRFKETRAHERQQLREEFGDVAALADPRRTTVGKPAALSA